MRRCACRNAACHAQNAVLRRPQRGRDALVPLNASPDVRVQIESFPPLFPPVGSTRGSGVEAVLLTNADLDHTLGLFVLREGRRLSVHATPTVRSALSAGLALDFVLDCYCGLDWHEPTEEWMPLLCADGTSSGLRYAAFLLPGKPPRYREKQVKPTPGDSIGYGFEDERTGGRLAFLPDVATLEEEMLTRLRVFDVLLLDGTFWSDDEMQRWGVEETTAAHGPSAGRRAGGQSGAHRAADDRAPHLRSYQQHQPPAD